MEIRTLKANALIVDDEHSGRSSLKILLQKNFIFLFDKIDTSPTLKDAVRAVSTANYNLVFLDIELSSHSGFDLLPYLAANTKVIFVTAYSEFAIKAIKERAFDYLLKPLNPAELRDCMGRYQKDIMGVTLAYKYMIVRESGESIPIKLEDIEYIRADGPYSVIHTVKKAEYTTAKTLKSLMYSLGQEFVRIHKSYLLNRHMIKSFKKDSITTIHNSCLPVSRVGAKELSQFF